MKRETLLTLLILGGLVLGILVGQFALFDANLSREALASRAGGWQTVGEIVFMRPLFMLIVPIVFVGVITGVTSIGSPQKLGLIGGVTALYFIVTTLLAVLLGLVLVNLIKPGVGVSADSLASAGKSVFDSTISSRISGRPEDLGGSFMVLVRQLIPENPLKAAVDRDVLGVVVFSLLLGLALLVSGEVARPVINVLEGLFAALVRLVMWIMWLAPVGVFCIIAGRVGEVGLASLLGPLSKYMLTVLLGLGVHLFIVLPALLAIFGRTNPYRFMWAMRRVIVTAFSTASSNASLPLTIEECQRVGGCSKRATSFAIPLGAAVNSNGTALYEAVAVSFLFQLFNYDLAWDQQFLILVTATLAAVGTAGIPSAGLVTMAIVITAVNGSLKVINPDLNPLPLWTIGVIFGVDRILDMCRTVINVMGDAIGARIITRLAPD